MSRTAQATLAEATLAEDVLRARKICRSFQGQALFGIYQTIFEQVRQQLLTVIAREMVRNNPPRLPPKAWAQDQLNLICKQLLDHNCLTALALAAQAYPPDSQLRQYALNELIHAVLLSGKLGCIRKAQPLIWDEAVHETLTYIYEKIDNFDPGRGKLMTWINFRLDRKLREIWLRYRGLARSVIVSPDDMQEIPEPEPHCSLATLIEYCLEEDRNHRFAREHIRGYPQANFRTIALSRLSGTNWESISTQFQVKISTLSSFFQRGCKKFRPEFQQYIQDHGGCT
jgi:DNA-directed RNA polymerase specialized sigma24 family protein